MKFIKEYKMTIALVVIFIILVVMGHFVITLLIPSTNGDICYGRNAGKEDHPIESATYEAVKQSIKEESYVSDVTAKEQCLLIKVDVTVTKDTTVEQAKALGKKVLDEFTDDQKGFYDFQLLITKEESKEDSKDKDTTFPIIGSKHKCDVSTNKDCGTDFVWTKDRVAE